MYKQIVNHPFLLHCPLDETGRPEISENLVTASGKLLVLDAMLKKLKPQGHKVLLFSTMTMILDLIADYLTLRPWKFLMLDGRHNIEDRQENIKLFNADPDIFLFLISTRAGGVGLNLAGADTVIIYDSDWVSPKKDFIFTTFSLLASITWNFHFLSPIFEFLESSSRPSSNGALP